jgi:NTP pyrophosphatase (non-canonical NTP hydrolase)
MENQHRKISGYRELTAEEIAAMNALKKAGAELGDVLTAVSQIAGVDQRCVAIARTELQTGLMWAVRAVARPEGF